MTNQELFSIVLILACYLVYQVVIHSGTRRHTDDRNVRSECSTVDPEPRQHRR